jgi:hypothetical protein
MSSCMTGVSVMTTTVAYRTDTNDCLTRFVKSFAMRSGKADVYRPPGGRTERQVAADVIVRLLVGGVLPRTPS